MDMRGIFGDPKKTREAFIDRELSRQAFQADRNAYQDELFDNTRHYVKPTINDSTPAPAAEPQPLVIEQSELEALTKIVVQAREDSNGRSSDIFPADYDVRRVQNCRGCTYEHAKRLVEVVDAKEVSHSYAHAQRIAKAALESKPTEHLYRAYSRNKNGKSRELTNTGPKNWDIVMALIRQGPGDRNPNILQYAVGEHDHVIYNGKGVPFLQSELDPFFYPGPPTTTSPGNVTVEALAEILGSLAFTIPPEAARGIAENVFELLKGKQ